jgi:hypothetical protein
MSITEPLAEILRRRPFAQPLFGVVTAVTAPATTAATGTATITLYGESNTVPCMASYTPAVGDVALVLVADRRLVAIGRMSTGPTHPDIPVAPVAPTAGTLTVAAVDAGTYQAGRLRTDRTDVLQGTDGTGPNVGAYVYGTTLAGTLAGLTLAAGRVWIDRRMTGSPDPQPLTLYLHAWTDLPAGPPTALDSYIPATPVPIGVPGWVALPAAWLALLADGTAAGVGIGDAAGTAPLLALASLSQSGQSGTIQVDWSA